MSDQNKKADLAVIVIEIPSPKWISAVPSQGGAVFGKHHIQVDCAAQNLLRFCGGTVELHAAGEENIKGLSQEPIEIRCSHCDFSRMFAASWKQAVIEWMRIAFSLAMDTIFNNNKEGSEEREKLGSAHSYIKVCVPEYNNRLSGVPPTPERPQWMDRRVIIWEKYGIATYTKIGLNTANLKFLAIDAALLMTKLEQTFQDAIELSAQLAQSASKPFHFNSEDKD